MWNDEVSFQERSVQWMFTETLHRTQWQNPDDRSINKAAHSSFCIGGIFISDGSCWKTERENHWKFTTEKIGRWLVYGIVIVNFVRAQSSVGSTGLSVANNGRDVNHLVCSILILVMGWSSNQKEKVGKFMRKVGKIAEKPRVFFYARVSAGFLVYFASSWKSWCFFNYFCIF